MRHSEDASRTAVDTQPRSDMRGRRGKSSDLQHSDTGGGEAGQDKMDFAVGAGESISSVVDIGSAMWSYQENKETRKQFIVTSRVYISVE